MKARTHSGRSRRRAGGFTLIELMVALTIGGFLVTTVYAVGVSLTRVFHQQHQLATAQSSLRFGVNQVKRDLARAGFLSTPRIDLDGQGCRPIPTVIDLPLGSGRLAGISRFNNDVPTGTTSGRNAVDPTGKNRAHGFTVDDITLMGNYESASEYAGASLTLNNPSELSISSNWYAFQRDFTTWYRESSANFDITAFSRAFRVGRMVRMRMPSGLVHFSTIRTVAAPADGLNVKITLATPVPPDCALIATGGWVAPVNVIRYFVRDVPEAELTAEALASTGPMAQLIRQEVEPGNKVTPLASGQGTRVVLDYVVGFNLEFTSTQATPPGQPDQYAPGLALPQLAENDNTPPSAGDNDAATDAVNDFPERVRSVVVDIAVRTPEVDPTFPFTLNDGDNCSRMRCFQVFPAPSRDEANNVVAGPAARVRRLRTEVFLPNIANEGY